MNSLKVFILVSIFIVVVNAGSLSVHRCQNAKDKVECNSQYTFISPFTKQWQYFYHLCCMMLDNFTVRSHIFHTRIAHCWSIYMHGIQCQPAQENFKTTFHFISHKIERILKEVRIQVYYSGKDKLFRSLWTHNDRFNEFRKAGVYRIPCECGLVYIHETGRNLSLRIKEDNNNCERAEIEKSAVAKHS